MSILHDTFSAGPGGNVSSSTWTHSVGGGTGRLLLVSASWRATGARTVSSLTVNGTAATLLQAQNGSADNHREELWYLLNPVLGDNEIIVTLSGSTNPGTFVASSYYGVNSANAASAFGTAVSATGTATPATDDATSASGQLVVDFTSVRHSSTPTLTVGAGQTERGQKGDGGTSGIRIAMASSDEPGAATVTMSWTLSPSPVTSWVVIAVPLKSGSGKPARVRYEENAFVSEAAGGLEILEDTGMAVHPERLAVDTWLRADGPYFPTPLRYANLIEDPSMMYVEAVRVDPRGRVSIQTAKETMLETLLRRLGGGA